MSSENISLKLNIFFSFLLNQILFSKSFKSKYMDMSTTILKSLNIINFHEIKSNTSSKTSLALASTSTLLFHPNKVYKHGYQYDFTRLCQRRKYIITTISNNNDSITTARSAVPPSNPFQGLPRKGWIAGLAISLVLSFLKNKWEPLISFKTELDKDIEIIEEAVEVVEKLAEVVEEAAEEVAGKASEGGFKNVATKIEEVAEMVAETTLLTNTAIHKVQELEEDVLSYIEQSKSNNPK